MNALLRQPDEGVGLVERKLMTWLEPLPLDSGETLAPVTLAYETYGTLNSTRDNAILVLHALSGDAHVAGYHTPVDRRPGWWDRMVGPGRPFDTNQYYVICSNVIGGCQGSTGPSSLNPATARPYGAQFPVITIADMVRAQTRLIDGLGITRLHAVAGGSMGGFQALEWAVSYPDRVGAALLFATSARSSSQTLAWNAIGRRAIMSDPRWRNGDYYGHEPPADGLAVARMIGHVTYLSEPLLERKFGRELEHGSRPRFRLSDEYQIERYLEHQGSLFNARFDANSYLYITRAMDYWDLPGRFGSLEAALERVSARLLVLSYASDWLYPTSESLAIMRAAQRAGVDAEHIQFATESGHDAFLVDIHLHAEAVTTFLAL